MEKRSYERITPEELEILLKIALDDFKDFVRRKPRYRPLKDTLLLIALCQGAAMHYIDGVTGVKDFDVWLFFAEIEGIPKFPPRRRKSYNIAFKRFGLKRVDILGRSIDKDIVESCGREPVCCIIRYLSEKRTRTARELAKKAVVGLYPEKFFGKVLWPKRTRNYR